MTATFLYPYLLVSTLLFKGKPVLIKTHAIKRAREREITYPDHVYNTIKTGKIKRFGKNMLKFMNSIICIGEDLGHTIIIKTIEKK